MVHNILFRLIALCLCFLVARVLLYQENFSDASEAFLYSTCAIR